MFTRRIGALQPPSLSRSPAPPAALSADWKAKYPELVFAVVPAENASGVSDRYAPFVEYLSKELGTKVTLRVANDYAAVIEGQRDGNDPHRLATARLRSPAPCVTGVKIDAFCIDVNNDGTIGYYSVFYVRADSPYQTIDDLKGKNLGLVDPNSTSGYNVPLLHAEQDEASVPEKLLRQRDLHRQPRERGDRAAAEDRRCRRQLVERRQRLQPDAHGAC